MTWKKQNILVDVTEYKTAIIKDLPWSQAAEQLLLIPGGKETKTKEVNSGVNNMDFYFYFIF